MNQSRYIYSNFKGLFDLTVKLWNGRYFSTLLLNHSKWYLGKGHRHGDLEKVEVIEEYDRMIRGVRSPYDFRL